MKGRLSGLIEEINEALYEDIENNPGQDYASAEWESGDKIIEAYVSDRFSNVDIWDNKLEKYLTNVGSYLTRELPTIGQLTMDWDAQLDAYAEDEAFQNYREFIA